MRARESGSLKLGLVREHNLRHGFKYWMILVYIGNIVSGFWSTRIMLTLYPAVIGPDIVDMADIAGIDDFDT